MSALTNAAAFEQLSPSRSRLSGTGTSNTTSSSSSSNTKNKNAEIWSGDTSLENLASSCKDHVIGAVQKTLKAHPEQPVNMMIDCLKESNSNTEKKTISLPTVLDVVHDAQLVSTKHRSHSLRVHERKKLPMHVELEPSTNYMMTTIGDAKRKFEAQLQKDIDDVTHGDSSACNGGTNILASDDLRKAQQQQTGSSDQGVTEYGAEAAAHLPSTCEEVQVFLLTPLDRELVFIDNAPYLGNVTQRRAARVPLSSSDLLREGASASGSFGKSQGGEGGDGENNEDDWNYDNSSEESSILLSDSPEPPEDIEQEICNVIIENGLARRAIPADGIQSEMTRMFSKASPNFKINVTRLVAPSDRVQLNPSLIDQIDSTLGQDESAPLVPVVVFVFGFEQDLIIRNIISAISTTQWALLEDKQLRINSLIEIVQGEKRRIRLQHQPSPASNQFINMNPAGYWMKVRERREARDRRREAMIAEKKKRSPQAPIPSNLSEQEKQRAEADRVKEQEQREAYLKGLEQRLNQARLARQARRSREDVHAAEAITNTYASGAVLVQSIIRGFLTRARIKKKNLLDHPGNFRHQYDEALSPTARTTLAERYARHANDGKHRNRINSQVPWAIESDILMSLCQDFPEAMCDLVPRAPNRPKEYRSWLPVRHRVAPYHDDDVSSQDESWICTTRVVQPKPQSQRYRMVNPYTKTRMQLLLSRCDLDDYVENVDRHYSKVSPLQRRAFAAIQAKCMHMLHTAYLDLLRRGDQLPTTPPISNARAAQLDASSSGSGNHFGNASSEWSFSKFVEYHRPELESWFNMPHLVSQCLHEVRQRHLQLAHHAASNIPQNLLSSHAQAHAQSSSSTSSSTNAPAADIIPILSTHYVAFEDFHAGKDWASMAEMSKLATGSVLGGKMASYLRGEGCVQLGPTRVFLVSDTMESEKISACVQGLFEGLRCQRLRWIATSPFATAYVHNRPVFAVPFSEQLAKNVGNYRQIKDVMLEDKLNPAAEAARAKLVAEKLLAEKQAALGITSGGSGNSAQTGNSQQQLGGATSPGVGGAGGGRAGAGGSRIGAGGMSALRSGFVGRTAGSRARQQQMQQQSTQQQPTSPMLAPNSNDPATARASISTTTSTMSGMASNFMNSNVAHGPSTSSFGSQPSGVGGNNTTSTPTESASSGISSGGVKKEDEPSYAVNVKSPDVISKLTVHKHQFGPVGSSSYGSAGGSQHSPSATGSHTTSFTSQLTGGNTSTTTVPVTTTAAASAQQPSSSGITVTSPSATFDGVDDDDNAPPEKHLSGSTQTGGSMTSGSGMNSANNFASIAAFESMNASSIIKHDRPWFGTSWIDVDCRFVKELIKHIKDESGALNVFIPTKGFSDPVARTVEEVTGEKSSEEKQKSGEGEGGGRNDSLSSPAKDDDDVKSTTSATMSPTKQGSSIRSRSHSQLIAAQQQALAKKKEPSQSTLLLGRFPARISPLILDVRHFKSIDAKTCRIVVQVPLTKKYHSSQSLGSASGISGLGGSSSAMGGMMMAKSGGDGLMGASVNSKFGASATGTGLMSRGMSIAGAKVGQATGPTVSRNQSRLTRSMSRVTAVAPGMQGAASSLSARNSLGAGSRGGGTDGGEGDYPENETPPPDVATLVISPEDKFKEIFGKYPFDEANFVRFPFHAIGGAPWLECLDQLLRDVFLHISRAPEEVCTVVSVSTFDDIFYAVVAALVDSLLYSEETLGSKAKKAEYINRAQQEGKAASGGGHGSSDSISAGMMGGTSSSSGGGGPTTSGGVRFAGAVSGDGGKTTATGSSPQRGGVPGVDNISKLSTGLDKRASRRFNAPPPPPPTDDEDYSAPNLTPEEIEAFSCVTEFAEKHDQDQNELQNAIVELDCMIHKCGLWTTFKMPVIEARRKAGLTRGTLDCRQHMREACCGLERYLWLLAVTRCLMDYRQSNPKEFPIGSEEVLGSPSLSVQKNQPTPRLTEFIEWRLGKSFFKFLYNGIDPWHKTPKTSPDPMHNQLYSMWPHRWYRNYFVASII